jgi:hypothetical protein
MQDREYKHSRKRHSRTALPVSHQRLALLHLPVEARHQREDAHRDCDGNNNENND